MALFVVMSIISLLFAKRVFALEATRDPVSITTSPTLPRPGDMVTIELSSYGTDLERATISWKENAATKTSGIGITAYETIAPNDGSVKTVTADITLLTGQLITKTINITPEEVDLLVESLDGYTPPFYKGRSLPVRESLIKVSALPQITGGVDSKDMVYTWKQDFKSRPDFSGYGKRYFVYKNAFLDQSDTIGVTASTRTGSMAAKDERTIALYAPVILFYEDHPSRGLLLHRTLTNPFTMNETEMTVRGVPYYVSAATRGDDTSTNLSFGWTINGAATSAPAKHAITLRKPEGSGGNAVLNLSVKNAGSTFQSIAKGITLRF